MKVMIKLVFLSLSFFLFLPATVFSQDSCPTEKPLKNLCAWVENSGLNEDGSNYKYRQKLYDAACTSPQESEEVRHEKIRKMWQKFEDRLVCTSIQFESNDGDIIKFGASVLNDSFINDVIRWKINLNRIDPADDATVLDYLRMKIESSKGTSLESKLKVYYKQFREAGAKHKSELKSTSFNYREEENDILHTIIPKYDFLSIGFNNTGE